MLGNNISGDVWHEQPWLKTMFVALLIGVAVYLLYAPSIHFGFLDWDDTAYIEEDSIVKQGLGKDSLKHAFTSFDNPYFMPLTKLSLMLDVSLWGAEHAAGFRLTNIFLHLFNSMLVLCLVYRASGQWLAATLVALLFAIHPQHVEAVVWIAGRKELLAGLFGIIGLCCYQQYCCTQQKNWYLLAIVAYGASLLNKPIWIVFPFLLLLWDFYPLQRIQRQTVLQCVREKIPFLLLSVAYALLFNYSMQIVDIMVGYYPQESWPMRGLLPVLATGKYLTNTFMPVNLVPFYAFPDSINVLQAMGWLAAIVLSLWFCWRVRHSYPGMLVACLWFGISLLAPLKIALIPQGEAIFVGDRYTYLAHIGLFTGLVLSGSAWFSRHGKQARHTVIALVLIALGLLGFSSRHIVNYWKTPEQLWIQAIDSNPGKGSAYIRGLLASYYHEQGRYNDALLAYKQAHEVYPLPYIYPLMVGSLLSAAPFRQYEESRRWLDKVLEESPAPAVTLLEIGRQELANRRYVRAEMFLAKAIERDRQQGRELNDKDSQLMLAYAQLQVAPARAVSTLRALHLSAEEKTTLCRQLLPSIAADADIAEALSAYCTGTAVP